MQLYYRNATLASQDPVVQIDVSFRSIHFTITFYNNRMGPMDEATFEMGYVII
jgi:hypothetical protein